MSGSPASCGQHPHPPRPDCRPGSGGAGCGVGCDVDSCGADVAVAAGGGGSRHGRCYDEGVLHPCPRRRPRPCSRRLPSCRGRQLLQRRPSCSRRKRRPPCWKLSAGRRIWRMGVAAAPAVAGGRRAAGASAPLVWYDLHLHGGNLGCAPP